VVEELSPGVYGALNTDLGFATGDFVAFLSSGAVIKSMEILAKYFKVFQSNQNVGFVYSC
jgi:hypothetical protein